MDSLLKNNNVVRVIALVLAVMIWLIVKGAPEDTSTSFVPTVTDTIVHDVNVQYDKGRVALVGTPNVKVTVHGDRIGIMQAKWESSMWKVTVDARNKGAGEYVLPATIEGLPQSVSAEPIQVKIVLASVESRNFDVLSKTEGELEDGYMVRSIATIPPQVNISGTSDKVSRVKQVVALVRLSKEDVGNIKKNVSVAALDDSGKPLDVTIEPQTVEVNAVIAKQSQTYPLRFQFQGTPKEGFAVESFQPSVTSVQVSGSLKDGGSFVVQPIDLSGIGESRTFHIQLNPPEGVTQIQPAAVDVQVIVTAAQRKTFSNIPIKVIGLASTQTAELSANTVDVVVEGARKRLDALKPEDLQGIVDLTGQEAGTHQVNVQIEPPEFLRVTDVKNGTLQVTIRPT